MQQSHYTLLQEIIATINNDVQARLTELQKSPEKYDRLLKKRVNIIDGKIDEILPIPREKGKPSNVVTQSIEKIFVERAVVLFERFLAKGPVRS